jgi:hypothetical protein
MPQVRKGSNSTERCRHTRKDVKKGIFTIHLAVTSMLSNGLERRINREEASGNQKIIAFLLSDGSKFELLPKKRYSANAKQRTWKLLHEDISCSNISNIARSF